MQRPKQPTYDTCIGVCITTTGKYSRYSRLIRMLLKKAVERMSKANADEPGIGMETWQASSTSIA